MHENTVAASALYNELVAAEVCEELGLATEPRTVTPGRRPVMKIAGVPHELIPQGCSPRSGGEPPARRGSPDGSGSRRRSRRPSA
nr:hypothetical protein [Streptomyces anulatus]